METKNEKDNVRTSYYNRVMSKDLKELLQNGGKFHWLIDFVKDSTHKELDFQNTENQFSIYRGTSKVLTLHQNGKIDAHKSYMNLQKCKIFLKKPNEENFIKLLNEIGNNHSFDRYIKKSEAYNEGWYQSLIGRRYAFGNKEQDEFIIFDKELMIHNSNSEDIRKWQEKIISNHKNVLPEKFSKPQGTPSKLDLIGLSKNGKKLWLIEVKQDVNTAGIYNSPFQIGAYYKRILELMNTHEKREKLQQIIFEMIKQKKELGLINMIPKNLDDTKLEKIKLVVVIGGKYVNPVAIDRLQQIKKVVECDINHEIDYYTCGEDGGIELVKDLESLKNDDYDINDYSFAGREKGRQVKLIDETDIFYHAKGGGIYGIQDKRIRKYVLNEEEENKDKNLYHSIRENAKVYFRDNKISWHVAGHPKGYKGPSGHILSSQIACLNHLFKIRNDEEAVLAMINGIEIKGKKENFRCVKEITYDKCHRGYIAFEVSGAKLLKEKGQGRGAFYTSIDALIYAIDNDKNKWLIPIEWKYTEIFSSTKVDIDKIEHYASLLNEESNLSKNPNNYMEKTYYQLMRQTLWAEQVIKDGLSCEDENEEPMEADEYLHIHVIPKDNDEFRRDGETEQIWKSMLIDDSKYVVIDPEELLEPIKKLPNYEDDYKKLFNYLRTRYWDRPTETTNDDNQNPSAK